MTPTQHIDSYIAALGDWRGERVAYLRALIHDIEPSITEEWKWDVPFFATKKSIFGIAAFKEHVKFNFLDGARLADPSGLFNNGLEAKRSRSIDLNETDSINENALQQLIKAALA